MRKRILYIHNGSDFYGASRSLLRLVTRLDRTRYEPLVMLPSDGPLFDALQRHSVQVVVMKSLAVISRRRFQSWKVIPFLLLIPISVMALWQFIRRNHIDLVHTNTGSIVSAGLAAKLAGAPHIWHVRDSFHDFRNLWGIFSKYILWSSDRVVCVSNAIARQFRGMKGKVKVIYNGIPLEEFEGVSAREVDAFKERFGLNGKRTVGVVGRIKFQRKGQDVFVRAVSLLKDRVNSVKYLIVGSPFPGNETHLGRLRKLIDELGVRNEVLLIGDVENIQPVYKALEVLVVPSCTPDPFAGVVLEAMAAGTPVVGTSLGGTLEQIEDGRSGLLVEPNNPELLAKRIQQLLTDETLSNSIRREARKRVEETFRFETMYNEIEQLYNEVLGS